MATRSVIGYLDKKGRIHSIYCHWDGYPDRNGVLLMQHWNDVARVKSLMALGNLSLLSKEIGEKHDFEDRSTHTKDWCLSYKRDRNEPGNNCRTFYTFEAFQDNAINSCADYLYLWDDGVWRCWDNTGMHINLYDMKEEA